MQREVDLWVWTTSGERGKAKQGCGTRDSGTGKRNREVGEKEWTQGGGIGEARRANGEVGLIDRLSAWERKGKTGEEKGRDMEETRRRQ